MAKYGKVPASKDEWITPKYITEALGTFHLDPCAPDPRKAPWTHAHGSFYQPKHDGLKEEWNGRVWLNPPYLKQAAWPWVRKLAKHGSGICLVNSTTDTQGFQDNVLRLAHAVLFLEGRISFYHVDGSKSGMPMQGSVLASFSLFDTAMLYQAITTGGLKGTIK